jgi:hypothetical protein
MFNLSCTIVYKQKKAGFFFFFATISSDNTNDTHLKTHGGLESVSYARQVQSQSVRLQSVQIQQKQSEI